MKLNDRSVGRETFCLEPRGFSLKLGNGELAVAALGSAEWKDTLRIQADPDLLEAAEVVLVRTLAGDMVAGAVFEHHVHEAVFPVELHSALARQVHVGLPARACVGQEHLRPASVRCDVLNVQDNVREVLVEDPRPHLILGASRNDLVCDLPKPLVGVR